MTAAEQVIAEIAECAQDPLAFVKLAYPWGEPGDLEQWDGPHDWQSDILSIIGQHLQSKQRFSPLQIAVASGHGIGKSALVGWVIGWALSTCTDARVVITANTGDQLTTKTVPETSKWFRLAINESWWKVGTEQIKTRDSGHEKTWRADFLTWSLERTEAFAGLHNKGRRIVLIFDEASAIPDKIWEVAEGAMTDEDTEIIWLAFGNPTQNTGRFQECFGKLRHRWVRRQIDSRIVPGTNKEQIRKWIEDYGEDSDFVRVRVKGEFPRAGSAQFIPSDIVQAARQRTLEPTNNAWKVMAVDVARFGDDQTVIGIRQGLKAEILERLRGEDTFQIAQRVIARIKSEKPRSVIIDGDGLGAGVVDSLVNLAKPSGKRETPHQFGDACTHVEEFHGAGAPFDPVMYFNRRAEVWGLMRDWLKAGADIPDDPEVETDLTAPEYYFSAKNQIQLERKDDMKRRGMASPDNGDMLAMTFAARPAGKSHEEKVTEEIDAAPDEFQKHLIRKRETRRREKRYADRPWWV